MIEITHGNILRTDAEALVNTVNCVGFMGKGIALAIKQQFPEAYEADLKTTKGERSKLGTFSYAEVERPPDALQSSTPTRSSIGAARAC